MNQALIKSEIKSETDIVHVRQKARQISAYLKFDTQEQTRIATAISELARNIYQYAKEGNVQFLIAENSGVVKLVIVASDKGPGIERIDDILNGSYVSDNGMGVGLMGAKRLMDDMKIDTAPGKGTVITMTKSIRSRFDILSPKELSELTNILMNHKDPSPLQEVQRQNHEILQALEELNAKKDELMRLNIELENTNRGVVALYAELDEKAEYLRLANETKTSFLADMTHEFRSPLNSIMSISQIVIEEARKEGSREREKQMGFILKAAHGLSDLVNDLLDIAKIEAGKIQVKKSSFSTQDIFGTLKGLMKPLNTGTKVNLVFDDQNSISLYTDEAKLMQILRNLISNAIKYTEEGEVHVSAKQLSDSVEFQVRDSGIGIPENHLNDIFEEFVQVDNPLQKKNKGTGLGLPLSQKLARLLSGSIKVESRISQGSTFTLTIPLEYVGPVEASYLDIEEKKKKNNDEKFRPNLINNKRVLVIDDEEDSRYAISKALEDLKIDYREAHNGLDGWPMTLSFMPDVVILDLHMPEKDGFEYLHDFLAERSTRDIPVILHTSTKLEEEELEYLKQVTVQLIEKSTDKAELRKAVMKILYPMNDGAEND